MKAQYQQAIDQHRQRVYSFAYYSLRAKEDAEDVTQDVFIKLWQHWQKIDHSKLGAWLMRVAHNAVIDHVRKRKGDQNNLDSYADVDVQIDSVSQAAEAVLDQAAFKQQIQALIKTLDDPFRSIIIMRDIQGLSYAEIQASLDMSGSQVKVYLHRGRRKLRESVKLRKLFDENLGSGPAMTTDSDESSKDRGNQHA
jgi:RNA polymerase sigma factor (sigma-70 family)